MQTSWAFISATFLALMLMVSASTGDRLPKFELCLSKCLEDVCHGNPSTTAGLSLSLRITMWTCEDDCKYQCTHRITDIAIQERRAGLTGSRIYQYYGKWPFWRLFGIQEPASVLFSIWNLWAHYTGGRYLLRRMKSDHPMKKYYRTLNLISMNAWICSAVFHTRDTRITERLDYFSAALTILFSLYVCVIRLFHLYRPPRLFLHQSRVNWLPAQHILLPMWGVLCSLLYIAHVSYLLVIPYFDYGYNMAANVVAGCIHNVLWASYSFKFFPSRRFDYKPRSYIPSYAWQAASLSLATSLCVLLELFDFPPWFRTIDAHSLWHLSTVPIVRVWYGFILEDALDAGWTAPGKITSSEIALD